MRPLSLSVIAVLTVASPIAAQTAASPTERKLPAIVRKAQPLRPGRPTPAAQLVDPTTRGAISSHGWPTFPTERVQPIEEPKPRPKPTDAPRTSATSSLFDGWANSATWPSDATLAVGPTRNGVGHILQTTNAGYGVIDKATGTVLDAGFFSSLFGVHSSSSMFDPLCVYDRWDERWVMIVLERHVPSRRSRIHVAISAGSTAPLNAASWRTVSHDARVQSGNKDLWSDFPTLGVNEDSIYLGINLYTWTSNQFGGRLHRFFDKAQLYGNGGVTAYDQPYTDTTVFTPHAIRVLPTGTKHPPTPTYVSFVFPDRLYLDTFANPFSSNPVRTRKTISIPSVHAAIQTAPQRGVERLSLQGSRLLNAVWRDNFVFTTHHVRSSAGEFAPTVCRWYQINMNAWPYQSGTPYRAQWGDAGVAGSWSYFPAITADRSFNVGLVFAASSDTADPAFYYTGRNGCDAEGTMGSPTKVFGSAVTYDPSPNTPERWGDYQGIAMDPDDDRTVWFTGQAAISRTRWGTKIGCFQIPTNTRRTLDVAAVGSTVQPDIAVTPKDCLRRETGTTPFRRLFAQNTLVTLTAPATSPSGEPFWRWSLGTTDLPIGNRTLTTTLTNPATATATYLCQSATVSDVSNTGVGGVNGIPHVDALDLPVLGKSMRLQFSNAPPGATSGFLFASTVGGGLPIFPIPPYVLTMPVTVTAGQTTTFPIPPDPNACGITVYMQTIIPDSTAPGNFAITNALAVTPGG